MAHEVVMVFDKDGQALYWSDGHSAAVEDSRSLWDVLWEHREHLGGVAHTHPWPGPTGPSGTDLTTFAAIEAGLGKRLLWPIVTPTHVYMVSFDGEAKKYIAVLASDKGSVWDKYFPMKPEWVRNIKKLRQKSLEE